MRFLILAVFTLFPFRAAADDPPLPLPLLFDVSGVAADDTLNVRSLPDAGSEVIGTLAPDATRIEITALSRQGNWGRLNFQEGTGWVAMRYLTNHPVAPTASGLPQGLQCFGTEPFWGITVNDDATLTLSEPDATRVYEMLDLPPPTDLRTLSEFGAHFSWAGWIGPVRSVILPGRCYDGMSDGTFGLHYFDDDGPRRGCCIVE